MATTAASKTELSQLLDLASKGLKIFPCKLVKGNKKPCITGWQTKASSDPRVIEAWYKQFPGCMWGIPTGTLNGIVVVDIDVKNGRDGRIVFDKLVGGKPPKTVRAKTPSGGLHYYFKSDDPALTGGVDKLGPGIDFQANGRLVIIPPSTRDTGSYKWITPFSFDKIAELPKELTPQAPPPRKVAVALPTSFDDEKRKVLWAFRWLDPERANNYQDWLDVIMCAASVSTTDADILDELMKFSQRSPKYRRGDVERKIATLSTDRANMLTIGSLIHKANEDRPRMQQLVSDAAWEVSRMSKKRFEDEALRLDVANALVFLGDHGMKIWVDRCTTIPGVSAFACEQQWSELKLNDTGMDELKVWAEADVPDASSVPLAPQRPMYRHFEMAFTALGFEFQRNMMNDVIYMNGIKVDDFMVSRIYMTMRDYGYKGRQDVMDAFTMMADQNRFNPIEDYLRALEWDGEDWIGDLGAHFVDRDYVFTILLRKWLIGAVNKVLSGTGEFNPVLVLDGPQRIGKSKFARWLCKSIPKLWALVDVVEIDRDQKLKLCNYFVLEAPEISSLHGRADRDALKKFLSMEAVHERGLYGRYPLDKPCTASFIGTLNNVTGFLADPTGESRYRPCTLQYIDWRNYTKTINVDQVWAQAVALWEAGETIDLDTETQAVMNKVISNYKMEDTLEKSIELAFDITRDSSDMMQTYDIEKILRDSNAPLGSSTHAALIRITNILKSEGLISDRVVINGSLRTVWYGIKIKESNMQPFDQQVMAERLFNAKVKE